MPVLVSCSSFTLPDIAGMPVSAAFSIAAWRTGSLNMSKPKARWLRTLNGSR